MAASSESISKNINLHVVILGLMALAGYPCDLLGACQGITMMSVQANTIGQMKEFNDRLDFIKQNDEAIALALMKFMYDSHDIRDTYDIFHDTNITLVDILAFLDGVSLYLSPYAYESVLAEGLSQLDVEDISKVTSSCVLEVNGGKLEVVKSWIGAYDDAGFKQYFMELNHIAETAKCHFSIFINSLDHVIALHYTYDAVFLSLYTTDANQLEHQRALDAESVIRFVQKAFQTKNQHVLKTSIYVKANDKIQREKLKQLIESSLVLHELNTFTGLTANFKGDNAVTPLLLAVLNEQQETVKLLLDKGAVPNAAISLPPDPKQPRHRDIERMLGLALRHGYLDAYNALLKAEGDSKPVSSLDGTTALQLAADAGLVEIVKLLLAAGADVKQQDYKGYSAIHLAVWGDDIEIITLLLAAEGIDVNQQNHDGMTALHCAAEMGYLDVVNVLLRAGAKVEIYNNAGNSPSALAFKNGHDAVGQAILATQVAQVIAGPSCSSVSARTSPCPNSSDWRFFHQENQASGCVASSHTDEDPCQIKNSQDAVHHPENGTLSYGRKFT